MMTKRQQEIADREFEAVLNFYGNNIAQLARAISRVSDTVDKWKLRRQVSESGAWAIERETKIFKARRLRPDVEESVWLKFQKDHDEFFKFRG